MSDLIPQGETPFSVEGVVQLSEDELKEWQMVLMTSADSLKKQEAFRRLFMSQLDVSSKRHYCFHLLSESDDALKKDVFHALESLGGSPDLFSCLEHMVHNKAALRVNAVKQLPQVIQEGDSWALSFVVKRALDTERDGEVLRAMVNSLKECCQQIHEKQIPDLVNMVQVLPEDIKKEGASILYGWAQSPERGFVLLKEVQRHGPGDIGEWLLPLAFESGLRTNGLNTAMAQQLLNHQGSLDPTGIGNLLIQVGAAALPLLREGYESCHHPVYVMFVMSQILERHEVSKNDVAQLFDFVVEHLRSGAKEVLPTILTFPFGRVELDGERRQQWIQELVYTRGQLSSEHLIHEIDYQVMASGDVASPVLLDVFRNSDEAQEALNAMRLLSKVIPYGSGDLQLFADELRDAYGQNSHDRGELLKAMGTLWSREDFPEDRRSHEMEECLLSLWRKSRTPERFEALSRGMMRCDAPMANRVTLSFVDLLESKLPELEKQSLKRKVDIIDGAHLEHQLLKAGMSGLISALSRQDMLPEINQQIKELLMTCWNKEVGDAVTLGPGVMPDLVTAFVVLIQKEVIEREKFMGQLLGHIDRPTVLKALPEIWIYLKTSELAIVQKHVLNELKNVKQMEPEDLALILRVCEALLDDERNQGQASDRLLSKLNYLKRQNIKQIQVFLSER